MFVFVVVWLVVVFETGLLYYIALAALDQAKHQIPHPPAAASQWRGLKPWTRMPGYLFLHAHVWMGFLLTMASSIPQRLSSACFGLCRCFLLFSKSSGHFQHFWLSRTHNFFSELSILVAFSSVFPRLETQFTWWLLRSLILFSTELWDLRLAYLLLPVEAPYVGAGMQTPVLMTKWQYL